MIAYEKAIEIINNNSKRIGTENIDLHNVCNRILREDVFSDMEMPPFDKSAMDGYACRHEDINNELEIIEIIPAGYIPQKTVEQNQCSKIMTGAMLPEGADCVIIVEQTEVVSENRIKFTGTKTGKNICYVGEDLKTGVKVLSAGTRIMAKHIASLAMVGCANPLVSIKPRVGILATGDEIVEPTVLPQKSQIRNTNSYQLYAQLTEYGCIPTYYGIAPDDENVILERIKKASSENDLILITGGVSMGDFDLVPGLLKKTGFNILFDKVAVQPGKPTVFGVSESCYVFGLPGNPVSSYLIFELFVKTFLDNLTGREKNQPDLILKLEKTITRKKSDRRKWIPVCITDTGGIQPIEYHGSAHVGSLAGAFGIINYPVGVNEIKEGTKIAVRPI